MSGRAYRWVKVMAVVVLLALIASPAGWVMGHPATVGMTRSHSPGPGPVPATAWRGLASTPRSEVRGHAAIEYGPFDGHVYNASETSFGGSVNYGTSVVIDNRSGVAFLANNYTLTSFSDTSGAVKAWTRIAPVYAQVQGLSIDPVHNTLYVGVTPGWPRAVGFVLVYDEATLSLVANITPFGTTNASIPVSTVYDPTSNQVFVQDDRSGGVAIINATSYAVRSFVPCPGSVPSCHGGGLARATVFGQTVIVASTLNRTLFFINPGSGSATGSLLLRPASRAGTPVYDARDGYLYIANETGVGLLVYTSNLAYVRTATPPFSFNSNFLVNATALSYVGGSNEIVYGQTGNTGVDLLNASTSALVSEATVPNQISDFTAGAVDPDRGLAILTSGGNNSTVSLTLPSLALRPSYPQYSSEQIGVGVDAGLGLYYILAAGYSDFFGPSRLTAIRESTGAVDWSVPLAHTPFVSPNSVAVDPVYHHVFVTDTNQTVHVYASATGAPAGGITLPNGSVPTVMDVDSTHHYLYIVESALNRTAVVNTADLTFHGNVSTPGMSACAIAADPTHTAAFEVNCRSPGGNVTEVFGSNLLKGASAPVGAVPIAVAVNASGYVFIANFGSRNVSVLSPLFGLSSFSTPGASPVALALAPDSTTLFVSTYNSGPAFSLESTISVFNTTQRGSVGQFGSTGSTFYLAADPLTGLLIAPEVFTGLTLLAAPLPIPGAPVLSAIAGNGSAEVFIAASVALGAAAPFQYNISVGQGPTGPWLFTNNTSALNYTFHGLHNGQNYYVIATGESYGGTSPTSAPLSVVPAGIPYPPNSPSATARSGSVVDVFWAYPASSGGLAVRNYSVLWATVPTGPWTSVSTNSATAVSFNVTGLSAHTTYYFRVVAWNDVGASHPSTIASATTQATTSSSGGGSAGTYGGFPVWYPIGVLAIIVGAVVAIVVVSRRDRAAPPQRPEPSSET